MFRFAVLIITHLRSCLSFRKMIKEVLENKEATRVDRYNVARKIAKVIKEKGKVEEVVTYEDKLPESNYLLVPNHQGRYDSLAIINHHEKPLSILIDEKKSNAPIEKDYLDVIDAARIDLGNARKAYATIRKVYDRIINDKEIFMVFPEGYFGKNKHNSFYDFNSGCFHFLKESKVPVVPVCLYDTYKGLNKFGKVVVGVHYLKPIYYEEYQELTPKEIAKLVQARIEEKMKTLNVKQN